MEFLRNKIRMPVISGASCFYLLNENLDIVLLESPEFLF